MTTRSGHAALITGAAKGLGAVIAAHLAQSGTDVVVGYNTSQEVAGQLVSRIKADGGNAIAVRMDVTIEASVRDAVTRGWDAFGRLDILVNNAGIYPHTHAVDLTVEEWDAVLKVNLRGPFLCAREVARRLIAAGIGGRIANITSIDAFLPEVGFAHYDAAKAGLAQLTRTLALEFGRHGITVNAIAPGLIDSPTLRAAVPERAAGYVTLAPIGRPVTAAEVAEAVGFLASDAAAGLTGQSLSVDGGIALAGYVWAHEQYTGRKDPF